MSKSKFERFVDMFNKKYPQAFADGNLYSSGPDSFRIRRGSQEKLEIRRLTKEEELIVKSIENMIDSVFFNTDIFPNNQ